MRSLPVVRIFLFLIILSGALSAAGCNFDQFFPIDSPVISKPTPSDCQNATDPTEQDIQYALEFPGASFPLPEWQRSYTVETMRTSVTWINNQSGALAYLEYLIYACGYSQTDVDTFFSDENLEQVILQNYDHPHKLRSCTEASARLTLHEFNADFDSSHYNLRIWIKPVNATRLLYLLLVFPEDSLTAMDNSSRKLFPQLPACLR